MHDDDEFWSGTRREGQSEEIPRWWFMAIVVAALMMIAGGIAARHSHNDVEIGEAP